MAISRNLLALVAAASQASAVYQGFNYGSTFTTGAAKQQSDFESDFKTAAGLQGTDGGFTSARFYTMIVSCRCNHHASGPSVSPLLTLFLLTAS
jgi:glucan endo-1,3-beta-D-glucosidase